MDGRPRRFTFSGNIFAGPVYVHRHDEAGQHDDVIHEPRRFGEFATASWVHRFLGAGQEAG